MAEYKIERVNAGHFILWAYGMPLDDATLDRIQRCAGVISVVPYGPKYIIDVSKETLDSDRVAGRVRGRITRVLNDYYHSEQEDQ